MLNISRNFVLKIERPIVLSVRNSSAFADDGILFLVKFINEYCLHLCLLFLEFKVLNLKTVRSRGPPRKPRTKQPLLPPR